MEVVVPAPPAWQWALLLPSLAALLFLLRRGLRLEAVLPPAEFVARDLLLVLVLRFLPAVALEGVIATPFLPQGLASGLLISVVGALTCLAVLLAARLSRVVPAALGLRRPRSLRNLGAVVLALAAAYVPLQATYWLWAEVLARLGHIPYAQSAVQAIVFERARGEWVSLAVLSFGAMVAAPVTEELLFRGFLFGLFRRRVGTWPAAVAASFVFAAIHGEPSVVLPIFLLGLLLNSIYLRTGCLAYPIVFHALFNGSTIAWLILGGTG
jgi:membrane protease YdiL (CAAX protease family)